MLRGLRLRVLRFLRGMVTAFWKRLGAGERGCDILKSDHSNEERNKIVTEFTITKNSKGVQNLNYSMYAIARL